MVIMGCGCGQTRTNQQIREEKDRNMLGRARNTVRRVWKQAQNEQPSHVVKRINKK